MAEMFNRIFFMNDRYYILSLFWSRRSRYNDKMVWMEGLRKLFPKTPLMLAMVLVVLGMSVHLTEATCVNETDCQNQINSQNSQLASIKAQQSTLQGQLNSAAKNLNATQAQLSSFQAQADGIKKQLDVAQASLDQTKDLFRQRVKDLYERGEIADWQVFFMDDLSFSDFVEFFGLQQGVMNKNIELITQYTQDVNDLTAVKKTADAQLAQVQQIRNAQAAQYSSIARSNNSLNSQIKNLSSSLKDLTAQQQQIIAAKLAATSQSTTVGEAPPTSETLPSSPYHPGFVFLTYGYPHRIGMNQYGAYGRAKAGQNFQQILQAYYGMTASVANEPATITVNGCNDYHECFNNQQFDFEDYLKHIYEMPSSWSAEALKAQAIAARTYAMRAGSTICPSQSCQEAKTEINAQAWQDAVDATRGLVLGGNSPINAFYSSTDGGYTCTDFSHNDPCTPYLVDAVGGAWSTANAYDGPNYGNSPWFHTFWGLYSGTPWISATDTADLFNAAILSAYDSSYNQYLSPQASGGWSYDRVIQELKAKGQPWIDQATAVGVGMDGRGNTNQISVVGANGSAKTLDGKQFRGVFNLRSPGTLVIYTSLFDVQKGG